MYRALIVLLGSLFLWHCYWQAVGGEDSRLFWAYAALLLVATPLFTSRPRLKRLILVLGALVLVSIDIWLWSR
jgi:hypothetical protein